ncbi:MAG: CPBP family intramembrane metalloprotease [Acidobacteriaceae bacterium]|nr:CPBP family intramembrane metalloprotease [Acidobacteriaceae bacterium]
MEPDPIDTPPALEPAIEIVPVQPAREPFWGYSDLGLVLLLVAFGLLVLIVIDGAIEFADPRLRVDYTPLVLPTNMAAYLVVYLALKLVLGSRYGKPVFSSLGWKRTRLNLLLVGAGGVALAFALSALASLLHTPKVETPFEALTNTPFSFAFLTITAVLIAPLFEELFFRGFIQPLLCRSLGIVAGIGVTAALFGALHAPEYSDKWQYAFTVLLAGVAFGVMRQWTKSIIPGTVMHGCFNAVSVVALAIDKFHKG